MSNRTYSSVPTDLRGTANFPYIFDPTLVQSGMVPPGTGNWRPWNAATDISSNNISLTGASFNISNIAVTGGEITVTNGNINVTNSIIPISGVVSAPNGIIGIDTGVRAVQVTNSAPMPFSGTVQGGNSLPFYVTGSVISVVTGLVVSSSSSVAVTGNPGVIVTGGTLNVSVTGGVLSASSSSVSLTGFSPTLPPLPVSGAFSANIVDTGNRSVLVVNPVLAVSGSFTATPGNTAITGFDSKIAPLAVSGSFTSTPGNTAVTGLGSVDLTHSYIPVSGVNFSASVSVSAVAITGQNSGSALGNLDVSRTYLPISGAGGGFIGIDTGIRAVNIVSSINQFVVNSGGYTAITGTVAVTNAAGFIGIDTGNRSVSIVNPVLAVSGVLNATVDNSTVVAAVASGNALLLTANVINSGISGQLAANLAGSAPVTGDIRNIPGTVLATSGTNIAQITGWNTGIVVSYQPVTSATAGTAIPSGVAPWADSSIKTGQILAANPSRIMFFIQNIHSGTPLYVNLGTQASSTGRFSFILNPSQAGGYGGSSFSDDHYRGAVTVSGSAWTAWEM